MKTRQPLSELRVVNKCPASWAAMTGTERVRHCSQCNKNVFNISDMTHAEAVELVRQTEGKVCVRYYQRRDGTILTRDCSVGDRVSLKARLALAAVAGIMGITMTTGCIGASASDATPTTQPQQDSSKAPAATSLGVAKHEKNNRKEVLPDGE
jgi:hypothetical protein